MDNISIDTSIMQQMANIALRARTAMEDAVKSANTVTEHNDWNCKERDAINESVVNVKKNNNIVNENLSLFSSKINELAEKFNEFDASLKSDFSEFDESVGNMLAIENTNIATNTTAATINITDITQTNNISLTNTPYWQNYHLQNLTKPISVVNFEDAKMVIQGADYVEPPQNEDAMMNDLAQAFGITLEKE